MKELFAILFVLAPTISALIWYKIDWGGKIKEYPFGIIGKLSILILLAYAYVTVYFGYDHMMEIYNLNISIRGGPDMFVSYFLPGIFFALAITPKVILNDGWKVGFGGYSRYVGIIFFVLIISLGFILFYN